MSNLDNSKPNKILGVISIILGKVWRLFWNSLTSLVTLFLSAFLAYFAFANFNEVVEYNKYGETTTATIDRIYQNKYYPLRKSKDLDIEYFRDLSVTKGDRLFIDYSYTINGKRYKKEDSVITRQGRRGTHYLNIPVEQLVLGNKIDIIYHKNSPTESFVLEHKDPREPAMALVFVAFLATFFVISIKSFAWNELYAFYCSATVLPIFLLIFSFYIIFSYPSVVYWNKLLLFGSVLFLVVDYILSVSYSRIYRRGTQAVATVTNVALSIGTSGRLFNPFMGIYEYKYQDASGENHFGDCRDLFFLNKSIKVGQKINIMYLAKKPRHHLRVGLI